MEVTDHELCRDIGEMKQQKDWAFAIAVFFKNCIVQISLTQAQDLPPVGEGRKAEVFVFSWFAVCQTKIAYEKG